MSMYQAWNVRQKPMSHERNPGPGQPHDHLHSSDANYPFHVRSANLDVPTVKFQLRTLPTVDAMSSLSASLCTLFHERILYSMYLSIIPKRDLVTSAPFTAQTTMIGLGARKLPLGILCLHGDIVIRTYPAGIRH